MTPFGNADCKVTSIFPVQEQLELVAGSSFTVVSSIREVRINSITRDHLDICLIATSFQVYVWG